MWAFVTSKNSNRAAVYSRYSTDKQDPSSIEDQVRVCTRLIEQRGCALAAIYSDAAMSGATAARPGLRQLLAGAEAGEFDVLVVESLDRLSRDHADLAWLFREISRSEEHTSELQSLMRISYAVFCLKKKNRKSNST